ncbi:MAG TPA: amino acid racemase [Candidatus Angelobacter sp.]|nr:amino acid racemase [Candidatus Angelobacter sp.]
MIDQDQPKGVGEEVWGILGGMGPLASAEFVNTIYQETIGGREQESPCVILLSDPTMPDRTEYLLKGHGDILLERLSSGLESLVAMGATRIVICCMTIHPLIPRLRPELRKKIISLVDVTLEAVLRRRSRHLLLCTTGTRKLELFEQHPLWTRARPLVVMPGDDDQKSIHQMLYEIKSRQEIMRYVPFLEDLMNKYGARAYIAGCTEMHLVAKAHEQFGGRDRREFCIDPLAEIIPMMRGNVSAAAARADVV